MGVVQVISKRTKQDTVILFNELERAKKYIFDEVKYLCSEDGGGIKVKDKTLKEIQSYLNSVNDIYFNKMQGVRLNKNIKYILYMNFVF